MKKGWSWKLPQLLTELGVTQAEIAQHSGIRRATISDLRDNTDTFVGILVAVYNGVKSVWNQPRPLNLHDLLFVEGQPREIRVQPRKPLPGMYHLPNLPNVYLNTPALRRELVPTQIPAITVRAMAQAASISEVALSSAEHGRRQPRISTLVALYHFCLALNPRLNLHDVLLIDELQANSENNQGVPIQ